MEAASVGAATPAMIEPSTAPTSAIGGSTTQQLACEHAAEMRSRSSCGTAANHLRTEEPEPEQVDDVDPSQHQAWNHRARRTAC
jgi:hypothetical protein